MSRKRKRYGDDVVNDDDDDDNSESSESSESSGSSDDDDDDTSDVEGDEATTTEDVEAKQSRDRKRRRADSTHHRHHSHAKTRITTHRNVVRVFAGINTNTSLTFIRHLTSLETAIKQERVPYTFIEVHVNSTGGCVASGMVMADAILSCTVPITTRIVGTCASAATFVAFAATEKCVMSRLATLMVHQPSGGIIGTAHEIRQEAENINVVEKIITRFYHRQCPRLRHQELKKLLKTDRELTADEALRLGFIDDIV